MDDEGALQALERDSATGIVVGVTLLAASPPEGPHFEPDDLTALVPLRPSETTRAGAPSPRSGHDATRSAWVWHARRVVSTDVAGRVQEALRELLPAAKELRAFADRSGAELTLLVTLVQDQDLEHATREGVVSLPALRVDRSTLGMLLTLGADLVVSPAALPEEAPGSWS